MPTKTRINGENYTQLPRLVSDDIILKGLPNTPGAPAGYGDLASAVSEINQRTLNNIININFEVFGTPSASFSMYNSGGSGSVIAGSAIDGTNFLQPYGWTFPTAAANKRWRTNGPPLFDMSNYTLMMAFKIKFQPQSSAQTFLGSMSGSSSGVSVVVRASTDATYPNAIELRIRAGGSNYDSYYITQNLADNNFHSVFVVYCAIRKISYVYVDGAYHGQSFLSWVSERGSVGNVVGTERLVIGAAAATSTNSWIHSGSNFYYCTTELAASEFNLNIMAANHHNTGKLEI